jgi:hypothetical protein
MSSPNNKIRVRVDFEDGHYSMTPVTSHGSWRFGISEEEKQEWIDNWTIEIDSHLYRAYIAHCDETIAWYEIMRELSNAMYEKREA